MTFQGSHHKGINKVEVDFQDLKNNFFDDQHDT